MVKDKEEKSIKSIRIEDGVLKTIEEILKSEKEIDSIMMIWEPKKNPNLYGDEDTLPEEIQEIIETLRKYNEVKKTNYRIVILPTFSTKEFDSFADYVKYAIDAMNLFFWGGTDRSLYDKVKSWRYKKKK